MTRIDQLEEARTKLRAYNNANPVSMDDSDVPTEDDHDEAHGLSIAAQNMAATHSDDELQSHCEDLHDGLGNADPVKRSYAMDGKVLSPSKKNPKVRRWIKQAALKHKITEVGTFGQRTVDGMDHTDKVRDALSALHHVGRREGGLDMEGHESALHSGHYLNHHSDFVESNARKYGVKKNVVAHALAYHAKSELAKQRRADGPMKNGMPQPLKNNDLTDKQFHKNLGGRAKSAFIKGMIARHGK